MDSDVAAEQQQTYSRAVYREDMSALKQQRKAEMAPGQKRAHAPDEGLKLDFVHGWVIMMMMMIMMTTTMMMM